MAKRGAAGATTSAASPARPAPGGVSNFLGASGPSPAEADAGGLSPTGRGKDLDSPGSLTGCTRADRKGLAGVAGSTIARRGLGGEATGTGEGGWATGGGGSAGATTAAVTTDGSASPELTVPVGTALGRTGRRGGLPACSLSTGGLASRGQGIRPKWPAAADTAPPTRSRPKAASTVDQRNPAAPRGLGSKSLRSRCLIRSRSTAVSSSSGSAERMSAASGPMCRSLPGSGVLSVTLTGRCLRVTDHRKAEPAPDGPGPRQRWA